MKVGFEETQSPYSSGSQSARIWTESWVGAWAYCTNCGNEKISQFPNNTPLADFFCSKCGEEYELKSKQGKFGSRVIDGAYQTKCSRVTSSKNPNLLLMSYDRQALAVLDLIIVPKHFFVLDIIEKRKPLTPSARRAGWVGSNILLNKIPDSGKIYIVRNGIVRSKELVLEDWKRTLFLRQRTLHARGWLLNVMKCVEKIGTEEFSLAQVYGFENYLNGIYPGNQNIRPKIRQQLQYLRDEGAIEFMGSGRYRLKK